MTAGDGESRPARGGSPDSKQPDTINGTDAALLLPAWALTPEADLVLSTIGGDVADASGYEVVSDVRRPRALGFADYQCLVPGLLIPTHSVVPDEGIVAYQFRPRRPRTTKNGEKAQVVKYESPVGSRQRIHCHPFVRPLLADITVPLWITEGVRKADTAVSHDLCCISFNGVWAWAGEEARKDWSHIALRGRDVYIAYDSDVMRKESVRAALKALTVFLVHQRARVRWVYFPEGAMDLATGEPDKVGLDDYLADHDVESLPNLSRPPELDIIAGGDLQEKTMQAIAALQAKNEPPFMFQRADVLVESLRSGVCELRRERLRHLYAKHVRWMKMTDDGPKPTYPDDRVVTNTLYAYEDWPFPELNRVSYSPLFESDGRLIVEPGYHASSGTLYLPPDGLTIRPVPKKPSARQVAKALALFTGDLFGEFPFVDDADRAHTLALALQPFARSLIRGNTPLYGVEAPKQGTGKTLLVEAALAPSYGEIGSDAQPHTDEELEKRITAALVEAAPVLFIDNVVSKVTYPSLATALTKNVWHGRILGESSRVTAPISCTWVLTANNPQYSDDIARRVIPIRLDANMEKPQGRSGFARSLPSWALENRSELIWAACVLVRHWLVQDRPPPAEGVPHMGKFGPWRRVMGGILGAVGVPGLLGNLERLEGNSPETEAFAVLAHLIVDQVGVGQPFVASTVADIASDEPDIANAIDPTQRSGKQGFASLVGRYLTSRVGQVIGDWRLEYLSTRGKYGGKRYFFVPKDERK